MAYPPTHLRALEQRSYLMNEGKDNTSIAVVVLGMHRSGTSMLANSLHLLGAEVARRVIPVNAAVNRDGFFEDEKIVMLNDRLLAKLDRSWCDYRPLPHTNLRDPEVLEWQNDVLEHLRNEYSSPGQYVIKDPRMARLWPFWKQLFNQTDIHLKLVHIVRQPEAVAVSLKQRNGMPLAYGLLLWSSYVVELLNSINEQAEATTLFYESIIANPQAHIRSMANLLGCEPNTTADHSAAAARIRVAGGPRPARDENALTLVEDLYTFSSKVYKTLAAQSGGGALAVDGNQGKAISLEYEKLLATHAQSFNTLRVLAKELMALNSKVVEIGDLHSLAQSVVHERDQQLETLNRRISELGVQLSHARSIVELRDEQLAESARSVRWFDISKRISLQQNGCFKRVLRRKRQPD